jgi:uncharacterized membrane protein YhfC
MKMPASDVVLSWLGYGWYFAGPAVLFLVIAGRRARRDFRIFALGVSTFLAAWIVIDAVLRLLERLGIVSAPPGLAYSLAFATLAATVEEAFRRGALRIVTRMTPVIDWRTVLIYAAGHSGGECILSALARLKTAQLAPGAIWTDAAYHVVGAFIVQACFTALVLRSIERKAPWLFFVAVVWHFVQDMPWPALLGPAGAAVSLGVGFGLYPCLLFWLLHLWYGRKTPPLVVRATARA